MVGAFRAQQPPTKAAESPMHWTTRIKKSHQRVGHDKCYHLPEIANLTQIQGDSNILHRLWKSSVLQPNSSSPLINFRCQSKVSRHSSATVPRLDFVCHQRPTTLDTTHVRNPMIKYSHIYSKSACYISWSESRECSILFMRDHGQHSQHCQLTATNHSLIAFSAKAAAGSRTQTSDDGDRSQR